ncbi:hypothetical protein [Diaphorobacter aerolatus]|uniref:Uncharacterized protein n=1 Tax=Diaphorobacter aerolatus TaxID=1288495 RepID=A0A7H0GLF4_9BURK|nr:hypothetical protein [Diaphorobacter aerolatus]QNP49120.1 hypothetical protein H9K75_02955 [Diaphorobacter aerolatus]
MDEFSDYPWCINGDWFDANDKTGSKGMKTNYKYIAFFVLLISLSNEATSKCSTPIPDSEAIVSYHNAAGILMEINNNELILHSVDTNKNIVVNINNLTSAYSAFGGDVKISDLKTGIQMRIWYVKCRSPKKGTPKAEYIEFFSNNPADTPDATYLKRNGR